MDILRFQQICTILIDLECMFALLDLDDDYADFMYNRPHGGNAKDDGVLRAWLKEVGVE